MSQKVFVTGLGIISSIGKGVDETLRALKSKKSGIGQIHHLNTIHKGIPTGETKFSDNELKAMVGVSDIEGFSRTALLGMIAAKEAFDDAGLSKTKHTTGILSGTTNGGMDTTEAFYRDFLSNDSKNAYITSHDCGDSTERIAKYLNSTDYMTTISTACSSSANSIMLAARLIKNGIIDRAVAGGTDGLSKFTLNGFNTLLILDKEPCKPFDDNRKGLNLGEGAGYIVLESEDIVNSENKLVYCELKGYGNANDAFHQTASSPEGEGAVLAMRKALANSGLCPEDIDYINAHGTATANNDVSEGKAIETIFGWELPLVSSTKSYTGHTLGASGGIEAVISALSIKEQMLFPNLNFKNRIKELNFSPLTEIVEYNIRNIISNSFGFGGNNTSLIFSKC